MRGVPASSRAEITPLSARQVEAVCLLARRVWLATYPDIISRQQIDVMLADRYASQAIHDQLDKPHHAWRLAMLEDTIAGFAHAYMDESTCKLDKLYVDPTHQRAGVGRALFQAIREFARQQHASRLWLQVNRRNSRAVDAYRKYGFEIVEARVFDIGNGFVMDDYVMELAP